MLESTVAQAIPKTKPEIHKQLVNTEGQSNSNRSKSHQLQNFSCEFLLLTVILKSVILNIISSEQKIINWWVKIEKAFRLFIMWLKTYILLLSLSFFLLFVYWINKIILWTITRIVFIFQFFFNESSEYTVAQYTLMQNLWFYTFGQKRICIQINVVPLD